MVVALPVFLFVSSLTNREIRRNPIRRSSPVRRWLTYLTLFLASCVLIGDLVSLVYNLLGGIAYLKTLMTGLPLPPIGVVLVMKNDMGCCGAWPCASTAAEPSIVTAMAPRMIFLFIVPPPLLLLFKGPPP